MAMRDDDKLVRQLSLVAFLMSQQRPVTADEIHEAVEGYGGMTEQAFLRRFYADRAEIESMGLRLAVERPGDDPFQGDLYALPPENYYLPELDFDPAELSALQTCLYLLEGQFAYAEPLRLALQHLTLGRPSPLDDHAARTVSVNLLGGDYSPEVAAHLTKIESAISRRKTIRFTYYSIGRDERSEREVNPYSLLYSAGNWYVVGLLPRARGHPHLPALAHRGAHHLQARAPSTTSPRRRTSTCRATATARRGSCRARTARPRSPSPPPSPGGWTRCSAPTAPPRSDADGSGVYTTTYGNQHELVAWILGLGAEARVLDPPDLARGRRRAPSSSSPTATRAAGWRRGAVAPPTDAPAVATVPDGPPPRRVAPSAAPPRPRRPRGVERPGHAGARGPGRALRPPPRAHDAPAGRLRRLPRGPHPGRRAARGPQPRPQGARGRHRPPQPHQLRGRLLRALRPARGRHRRRAEGDVRRPLRPARPPLAAGGEGAAVDARLHRRPPPRRGRHVAQQRPREDRGRDRRRRAAHRRARPRPGGRQRASPPR